MPVGKLVKMGIWENGQFVGVIIFGLGATPNLSKPYGLTMLECCELVRIAMTRHVTPVSRCIAIALRKLKKFCPGVRLVVSFADAAEKHHGGIYQASNWIYAGRTADHKFPVLNGRVTHPRSIQMMIAQGKLKSAAGLPWVLKPGKHRYLMPLDDEIRERVKSLSQPFPKRAPEALQMRPPNQAGEGG